MKKVSEYQQANATGVLEADPHRVIQMLMEGALDKIAMAKGNMARDEYELRNKHINLASQIIAALQSSLDLSAGEIAENLDGLYAYMRKCLLDANLENDPKHLDEVAKLLGKIKSAWDAIEDEVKPLSQPMPQKLNQGDSFHDAA